MKERDLGNLTKYVENGSKARKRLNAEGMDLRYWISRLSLVEGREEGHSA